MPPESEPVNGDWGEQAALCAFGVKAREAGPVAVENVLGKAVRLEQTSLRPTADADLEEEFGELRHVAIEARVALSEVEAHLSTLLIPLPGIGALLDDAVDPEALDESAGMESVEQRSKELLHLLSLMLFGDSPIPGEITLSAVRVDGIDESAGMVADSAGGAALHRIDHALTVGENDPVRITLVAPETLLSGLVAALAGDGASDEQGADAAGAVDEQGTDEADEAPMFDDEELIAIDPVDLPDLDTISSMSVEGEPRPLDLLLDVSMQVSAELGRCQMTVEEILSISPGSVVELDKLAGEPVDVLINDLLIARGEVVMVDENFEVRITEILSPRTIPTAQAEPV